MFSSQGPYKLVVVGSPGHGKSTFLNALSGQKKPKEGEYNDSWFAVGAGGKSCTKEPKIRQFQIQVEGKSMTLQLVDTPGFPDPDSKCAVEFYDAVVQECNKEVHAIVWLLKAEREVCDIMSRYKALMGEFNKAQPPIIVLVNGMEVYEDDDERDELLKKHQAEFTQIGANCAEAAGVQASRIIVSTTKPDLKKIAARELGFALMGTVPRASKINGQRELAEKARKCQDDSSKAAAKMQSVDDEIAKLRNYIEEENEAMKSYESQAVKWTAGTFFWVPFVGLVAVAVLWQKAKDCETRIAEYNGKIAVKKQYKQQLANPATMKREAEEADRQLKQLLKALGQ